MYLWALMLFVFIATVQGNSCPSGCKCDFNPPVSVNCIGQGLDSIPPGIPNSTVELYLAKNKFITLKAKFLTLPSLKVLGLENNLITDIQGNSFQGVPNLTTLYLTKNEIPELKKEVFIGLKQLGSLFLGQNKLKAVPDLSYTPNLSTLNIDNNQITSAKFQGFEKFTKLKSITLSHNPLVSLKAEDFSSLSNSPISKFNLNHCSLTTVDNGTFLPFNSLQSLVLSYNRLGADALTGVIASLTESLILSLDLSATVTSLPRNIFQPLSHSKLHSLTMRHCSFGTLLNGTFEPLSHLGFLDFGYSQIVRIENGTFKPLVKLTSLTMDHCRLEDIPYPLPASLTHFDINNNNDIYQVQKNAFPVRSKLETVKLSYCSVRIVSKESFNGLAKLKTLDLSHNSLAGIPKGSFMNLTSLTNLNLAHNKLTQISTNSGIFNGLTSLLSLDMSYNFCSDLAESIFDPLTQLQTLLLQFNQLNQQIHSGSTVMLFSKLKQLKTLNLNSNAIQTIGDTAFQGGSNISNLLLSDNRITHWERNSFKSTVNLAYVDLSVNSVSVINQTSVANFASNLTLNLTGNPFSCWCDLMWFRNWINTTEVTFSNLDRYTCTSPREMADMSLLEFDPTSIKSKCYPPYILYIVVPIVITLVLVLIIGIISYRLRWKIRLSIYRMKHRCCSNDSSDPERTALLGTNANNFEVTISYGPDRASCDWAVYKLFPKLKELGFSTFIEDEYVLFGASYTKQIGQICEAMTTSRYILLVMSGDYMSDGRRNFEVDYANSQYDLADEKVYIVPIIFPENSIDIVAKAKVKIAKTFPGNRCTKEMTWTEDTDGSKLFWKELRDFLHATKDKLPIN